VKKTSNCLFLRYQEGSEIEGLHRNQSKNTNPISRFTLKSKGEEKNVTVVTKQHKNRKTLWLAD